MTAPPARAAGVCFGEDGFDLLHAQPQNRCHGPFANGYRRLHGLAAQAQQFGRVGNRQRTHGRQRGIFAQRVTSDKAAMVLERDAEFSFQRPNRCQRDRHQRRLGVLGQLQIIVRAFEHQRRKVLAQGFINFIKDRAGRWKGLGKVFAHSDFLAALTGEHKSSHDALFRSQRDGSQQLRGFMRR